MPNLPEGAREREAEEMLLATGRANRPAVAAGHRCGMAGGPIRGRD
ncbi:MAG TPA: hypothetical protein VGM87_17335 [Roseomonas sp.]|jgi:hypothetical protein